ncbi:MAG: hypothetical protein WAT12_00500, partial [Candidatus Nitrotoga sp.]
GALLELAIPILCEVSYVSIDIPIRLLYSEGANVAGNHSLLEFSGSLYQLTLGNSTNAFLGLVLAALLVVVIGVFPSAMSEVKLPVEQTVNRTRGMASWLNGAITSLKLAEWLLIVAWVLLAIGYIFKLPYIAGNDWVTSIGLILAGTLPAMLLGRKILPSGLSLGLDIILDVSNWMRERPFAVNPRGQIMVRYLSLLKYLSESGYNHIIVVAHSQGAVVTVDSLRLLAQFHTIRDSVFVKSKPTIELVTAGSPLRQIYREVFPHQYGWVVSKSGGPDISCLACVRHWINVYRSGDYVGRSIWSEPKPGMMNTAKEFNAATPVPQIDDICLGAGAHLHYFDGTSNVIGTVVAKLICCGQSSTYQNADTRLTMSNPNDP